MSKLKYVAGNIVTINDEIPPGRRILYLMGSLFLGLTQKIPGTEVTSDPIYGRNSTSYSGTESLWDSTRERYGEDMLVHHSLWYDDEDYV